MTTSELETLRSAAGTPLPRDDKIWERHETLLEQILLQLSPRDLLACARSSKSLNSVICSSPRIQLFLRRHFHASPYLPHGGETPQDTLSRLLRTERDIYRLDPSTVARARPANVLGIGWPPKWEVTGVDSSAISPRFALGQIVGIDDIFPATATSAGSPAPDCAVRHTPFWAPREQPEAESGPKFVRRYIMQVNGDVAVAFCDERGTEGDYTVEIRFLDPCPPFQCATKGEATKDDYAEFPIHPAALTRPSLLLHTEQVTELTGFGASSEDLMVFVPTKEGATLYDWRRGFKGVARLPDGVISFTWGCSFPARDLLVIGAVTRGETLHGSTTYSASIEVFRVEVQAVTSTSGSDKGEQGRIIATHLASLAIPQPSNVDPRVKPHSSAFGPPSITTFTATDNVDMGIDIDALINISATWNQQVSGEDAPRRLGRFRCTATVRSLRALLPAVPGPAAALGTKITIPWVTWRKYTFFPFDSPFTSVAILPYWYESSGYAGLRQIMLDSNNPSRKHRLTLWDYNPVDLNESILSRPIGSIRGVNEAPSSPINGRSHWACKPKGQTGVGLLRSTRPMQLPIDSSTTPCLLDDETRTGGEYYAFGHFDGQTLAGDEQLVGGDLTVKTPGDMILCCFGEPRAPA